MITMGRFLDHWLWQTFYPHFFVILLTMFRVFLYTSNWPNFIVIALRFTNPKWRFVNPLFWSIPSAKIYNWTIVPLSTISWHANSLFHLRNAIMALKSCDWVCFHLEFYCKLSFSNPLWLPSSFLKEIIHCANGIDCFFHLSLSIFKDNHASCTC